MISRHGQSTSLDNSSLKDPTWWSEEAFSVLDYIHALADDWDVLADTDPPDERFISTKTLVREVETALDRLKAVSDSGNVESTPDPSRDRRRRCPECRGRKLLPGMIKTTEMGSGMGSKFGPCPTCDGLGYVTDEMED